MQRIGMWLLMAMCVLVYSQVARADDAPAKKKHATIEERFKKMDTNNDGKLSLEEFTAGKEGTRLEMAKKMFPKWDTDKDGFLSLDEYKAGVEAMRAAHHKKEKAG